MKRWWIAVGLAGSGLLAWLVTWLVAPVTTIATVHVQFTGQYPGIRKALDTEAQIMSSGMIRNRVIASLSETEKKLLGSGATDVPPPILQLNPSDSTFSVGIINSRPEVAELLAERYVSEYLYWSRTLTSGPTDAAIQTLREAYPRLRQEIETGKAEAEALRRNHRNKAADELEKSLSAKERRHSELEAIALDRPPLFHKIPLSRLRSETASLNRLELFFRRAD